VTATATTTGDIAFADDANGTATLDFWFRVTQTAPILSGLSSIPITLKVTALAIAAGTAQGEVWLLPPDEGPTDGGNVLDTGNAGQRKGVVSVNASPDQVFQIIERATASPDCTVISQCVQSIVVVDPFIAFDQQSFDAAAAQLGVPSIPLDQFFTLDFSSNLSQLPSIPSNLGQDLGVNIDQLLGNSSTSVVAEPSALALLLTGLGILAAVERRARASRAPGAAGIAMPTAATTALSNAV
jgi:hypothetical protein